MKAIQTATLILFTAALAAGHAQVGLIQQPTQPGTSPTLRNSPVRITVEPGKKTDPKIGASAMRFRGSVPTDSMPGDLPNTTARFYHVKLANISTRNLTNLNVRWSIVAVNENRQVELTDGTVTCSIAPVRNFEFETGLVTVRPSHPKGGSKVTLNEQAHIVGYLIEVFEADQLVATSSQPANLEQIVKHLRQAKTKPKSKKPR